MIKYFATNEQTILCFLMESLHNPDCFTRRPILVAKYVCWPNKCGYLPRNILYFRFNSLTYHLVSSVWKKNPTLVNSCEETTFFTKWKCKILCVFLNPLKRYIEKSYVYRKAPHHRIGSSLIIRDSWSAF